MNATEKLSCGWRQRAIRLQKETFDPCTCPCIQQNARWTDHNGTIEGNVFFVLRTSGDPMTLVETVNARSRC